MYKAVVACTISRFRENGMTHNFHELLYWLDWYRSGKQKKEVRQLYSAGTTVLTLRIAVINQHWDIGNSLSSHSSQQETLDVSIWWWTSPGTIFQPRCIWRYLARESVLLVLRVFLRKTLEIIDLGGQHNLRLLSQDWWYSRSQGEHDFGMQTLKLDKW